MHLYIATRGIKNRVDQFITELQGKYLPTMYKGQPWMTQVGVRPIQLWEIVFPEDSRDIMLTTILQGKKEQQTQHKRHNWLIWTIRKALGIQPVADYKTDRALPIQLTDVEVVGIGEKKDYWVLANGEHKVNPTEEEKKTAVTEGL